MRQLLVVALALAPLGACGGTDSPKSLVPVDTSAFTQVRDCRLSADHDLNFIRVLTDAVSTPIYTSRTGDYPTGALILKAEYDNADQNCSGPIVQWTLMEKLDTGSSPDTLDWHWQKVKASGSVISDNGQTCFGCHSTCGVPPDGYESTCSMPP